MRPRLTFEILDEKIDEYVQLGETNRPGRLERFSFVVGLLSAGGGLLVGAAIGGASGVVMARWGLFLEIAGFAVSMSLMVGREWQNFARQRRTFSKELDTDYAAFRSYVAWLRTFPTEDLRQRLTYVQARRETMSYRLGLYTGGVERLGVLPVLIALYLQFKDWHWAMDALARVNWVGAMILWALFLVYAGGWWIIRLKSRLDSYESLLKEATATHEAT